MRNRCHFDNFMVTDSNRKAYDLFVGRVQAYPHESAPIFLNGPVGAGKTHLLFSFYNAVVAQGWLALYQSCNDFISALIRSIQEKDHDTFTNPYMEHSFLLLDDIQFLSKKPSTMEELLYSVKEISTKTQVILAGSFPMEEGDYGTYFLGRFQKIVPDGIVAKLALPGYFERQALLDKRLRDAGVIARSGKLAKLSRKRPTMRQLEGVANSICAGELMQYTNPSPY